MKSNTSIIFKQSKVGRRGFKLPDNLIDNYKLKSIINAKFLRKNTLQLPEVSESQVVRHFSNLSIFKITLYQLTFLIEEIFGKFLFDTFCLL